MNKRVSFSAGNLGVWLTAAVLVGLPGCTTAPSAATPLTADLSVPVAMRLHALGRPDVLALGEQHDAPDHHRQHQTTVQTLAELGELGGVVLEMADSGHDTLALPRDATAAQVQRALGWRDSAWPWAHYGPAVMSAVAAGVPVWGGNLPRQRNAAVMKEADWDTRVPHAVLQQQRLAVREGHCNLLPAGQIGPMTRIQLARDIQLAQTVEKALVRGKTIVLLTGSQHAHRQWGVPLHLPPQVRLKSVRLAADGPRPDDAGGFDAVWLTAPAPPKDHCAELRGGR